MENDVIQTAADWSLPISQVGGWTLLWASLIWLGLRKGNATWIQIVLPTGASLAFLIMLLTSPGLPVSDGLVTLLSDLLPLVLTFCAIALFCFGRSVSCR